MVHESLNLVLGKTVKCVYCEIDNGIVMTFTDGTVLHVWGGIPRSHDVNATVTNGLGVI